MLRELYIKNVAVIEDASISFKDGLNVLTGETGAGKSIIIDSINMILGERTSRDYVRFGQEKARVQAVFDLNEKALKICEELGCEPEEDTIILSREVTADGKSTARINGIVSPLSVMKNITSALINIHGQHDNQEILSNSSHIKFLDDYANSEDALSNYREIFNNLKEVEFEIDRLSTNEKEKTERADLLSYQIDEIESADLKLGEEEELILTRDEIQNSEKISSSVNSAYNLLYGSENNDSITDMLSHAVSSVSEVSSYSEVLKEAERLMNDCLYTLEDVSHSLKDYSENIEFDEKALEETEDRLEQINKLKRKYGNAIEKILEYLSAAKDEFSKLEHSDELLNELYTKKEELTKALLIAGEKLSKIRKASAKELEEKITESLHELNMEHASFGVQIDKTEPKSDGLDDVYFLISANSGEPMKQLTKIASGGELSRTMLALKSILSDSVDTLIFDEIDTGVSGMAAKKIAIKLFELAINKQVLCITHLPQIASISDEHYLIEKKSDSETTKTSVTPLNREQRIIETARLSGGDVTELSKKHAEEMISSCEEYKARRRK